jgi:predicted kinase
MLGYPGSGKTSTAKIIASLVGAELIWEDLERKKQFPNLTFSEDENNNLHNSLNLLTEELLKTGKSVVYDTSFNRYIDRRRMYDIAAKSGSDTVLVWVQTDTDVARVRATQNARSQPTRPLATVLGDMDGQTFDRLVSKLEPPIENEQFVTMDGTKIADGYVRQILGL